MTDTQESKLGMFETVIAFLILQAYISIWSGNLKITAAKTWLESAITRIRLYSMVQKADHKGLTSAKKQYAGELVSAILKVIDGLVPYATDTKNADLLSVVRIPKSTLDKAKDNDLVDYANLIYDKAFPLTHELADFNVTEADILNVKTKKGIYTIAIPAKRFLMSTDPLLPITSSSNSATPASTFAKRSTTSCCNTVPPIPIFIPVIKKPVRSST